MFLKHAIIGRSTAWRSPGGIPEEVHVFSEPEVLAINAAIAARRALLVRGEPGTGKTQLAKAAAVALKRAFLTHTVDSRSEARDLLWHFDTVSRLAEAQLQGATSHLHSSEAAHRDLAVRRFIQPRALWWALDWQGAEAQAKISRAARPPKLEGCDSANGVVVLIDEIDKADSDVPNGLLEALGAGQFTPHGFDEPIIPRDETATPLVIITTNEERSLPDAFLRRCLVLHLALPDEPNKLIEHLIRLGNAHFSGKASPEILERAARLVVDDREQAQAENWRPFPGQAEYLDLIRAVLALAKGDAARQKKALEQIKGFALRKHIDAFKATPNTP